MIFSNGCDSVFESLYLNEDLTPYPSKADIIVNPNTDAYLNKVIIFSMPADKNLIKDLSRFNKVISRYEVDNAIYEPYDESIHINVAAFKESNNLYSDRNFKTLPCYYFNYRLYVIKAIFENTKVGNDLTFLGYLNKLLNMNLNTYVSACLCMAPFDNFAYAKVIQDEEKDNQLTKFIVDRFNIPDDVVSNLHIAKVEKSRIDTFKSQTSKLQNLKLSQWNFPNGAHDVLCSSYRDPSTSIIILEIKNGDNYFIY